GALEVFELAGPRERNPGKKLDLLRDCALRVLDDRAEVAPTDIDVDPPGEAGIFRAQHRRAVGKGDLCDRRELDLRAALGDDGQCAQLVDRVALVARVAHVDREALPALDGFADVFAPDRRGYDRLHVHDAQAIARGGVAVDAHIDVAATAHSLGECRRNAGHILDDSLDLPRARLALPQVSD